MATADAFLGLGGLGGPSLWDFDSLQAVLQKPTTWTIQYFRLPSDQESLAASATIMHMVTQTGRVVFIYFAISVPPRELAAGVCGPQSDGGCKSDEENGGGQKRPSQPVCAGQHISHLKSDFLRYCNLR